MRYKNTVIKTKKFMGLLFILFITLEGCDMGGIGDLGSGSWGYSSPNPTPHPPIPLPAMYQGMWFAEDPYWGGEDTLVLGPLEDTIWIPKWYPNNMAMVQGGIQNDSSDVNSDITMGVSFGFTRGHIGRDVLYLTVSQDSLVGLEYIDSTSGVADLTEAITFKR
jgi:hypothetical protein